MIHSRSHFSSVVSKKLYGANISVTTGVFVVYKYKIDETIVEYLSEELDSDIVKKMVNWAKKWIVLLFGEIPAFFPLGIAASRYPGSEIEKKSLIIAICTNFPCDILSHKLWPST